VSDLVDYRSNDDDNFRWRGFPFRAGDIVISTRSKHGTTWMQLICALLIHDGALPKPLGTLSPWLDHRVEPLEEVVGRLERQRRRRIIKTHTPLDGVPIDPRATYVVVARDPLDAAVSLYHQGFNLDRARIAQLSGQPPPAPTAPLDVATYLHRWIHAVRRPTESLESIDGVLWHLHDAWRRRDADANVVLVHYADLEAHRERTIRSLAANLRIDVSAALLRAVVAATDFTSMRDRANEFAPDRLGVLRDPERFFRRGASGEGRTLIDATDYAHYERRIRDGVPAELASWLLRGGSV
jgi:hypothetical protein